MVVLIIDVLFDLLKNIGKLILVLGLISLLGVITLASLALIFKKNKLLFLIYITITLLISYFIEIEQYALWEKILLFSSIIGGGISLVIILTTKSTPDREITDDTSSDDYVVGKEDIEAIDRLLRKENSHSGNYRSSYMRNNHLQERDMPRGFHKGDIERSCSKCIHYDLSLKYCKLIEESSPTPDDSCEHFEKDNW